MPAVRQECWRSSSKPLLAPAVEYGWQGNPIARTAGLASAAVRSVVVEKMSAWVQ